MILEIMTFLMFVLVLVLKYGAVNRMVKLSQRLRDAETRCRKQKENLKQCRAERMVAERDEAGLARQRASLEDELRRVSEGFEKLKKENTEIVQELLKKNARLSPDLRGVADEADSE